MALKSNAIVTLEEARLHLNVQSITPSMQAQIENAINVASQRIESYLDRKVVAQDFTRYFEANNLGIMLSDYPVISITSISEDESGRFLGLEEEIDSDNYELYENESFIAWIDWVPARHRNKKTIEVVYRAGYENADIPSDIKMACLYLVEYFYSGINNKSLGVTSKSKGDEQVSYESGIPIRISQMLEVHKRLEIF